MNRPLRIIMVSIVFISLGMAVFINNKDAEKAPTNEYVVKKIIDGDTIEIERYGKTERVRMIGVDTPETLDPRKPVQCFGKEASEKSKELLTGKKVRLEYDNVVGEQDKYGRTLAYVWEGSSLINLNLIKDGFAHEYTYRNQNYKYQSEFKNAQTSAKENSLGLWSEKTCNGITK